MAIEVRIPKEITEYKEKIMFGLSIRQLVCFGSAVILSVGSYFLLTKVLGMSMDTTGYIIIFEAIPFMAMGFIKKDGMPFEKYAALLIRHKIGQNKLFYKTELLIDQMIDEESKNEATERKSKYAWIFEKEDGTIGNTKRSRKEKKHEAAIRECTIFMVTKKSRKEKSKAIKRKVKAARQDYRAAKRREKKEIKKRGGSEVNTTTN